MRLLVKIAIGCACILMPQSLRAELGLFSRLLLSNKAYAKNIEVKAYILTQSQSAALLADPSKEPVQMLASELSRYDTTYLVVRVRDLGGEHGRHAWGILACDVPGINGPMKIPVISIDRDFCNYLISLEGKAVAESFEKHPPKITYEWDALYTK